MIVTLLTSNFTKEWLIELTLTETFELNVVV